MSTPIVNYTVPLCAFERQLLAQVAERTVIHAERQILNELKDKLFPRWSWARLVNSALKDDLKEEEVEEQYQGDKELAYNNFLHFLKHQGALEQSLDRAETLERANPDFLTLLGDRPIEESFGKSRNTYDVFKSLRTHEIRQKAGVESEEFYHNMMNHPAFNSIYKAQISAEPANTLGFSVLRDQGAGETRYELVDKRLASTVKKERHIFKQASLETTLEDPRSYVSFIPFSELAEIDAQDLAANHTNTTVPFAEQENFSNLRWVTWKTIPSTFIGSHLLYAEDELYGYCITNNWFFPAHYHGDKILFSMRPVEDTEFFSSLKDFWESWNDCSLTWSPSDSKLYLLETVPGLRYRIRQKRQDKQAALRYFRNMVEAHAAGTLGDTTIQEILGTENYCPLFEYSLRFIPSHELSLLSELPIGSGRYGDVYRAVWHRPESRLATMRYRGKDMDVVLKDIFRHFRWKGPLPEVSGRGTSSSFVCPQHTLDQLQPDLIYTRVGGSSEGCVDFFGISTIPRLEHGNENSNIDPGKQQKMVLIMGYANEGPVHSYLKRTMSRLSYVESWYTVVKTLFNVANGLHSLHSRGIIHRDLHLNNILVTLKHYPDKSLLKNEHREYEYSALVADIDEGQDIDTETTAGTSVGAREFHAPEIQGTKGWTTAADVFAFGVVACKFLDIRLQNCKDAAPDSVRERASDVSKDAAAFVPTQLKQVVLQCISAEAKKRPLIRDVIDVLDELSMDFFTEKENPGKEKVEWTTWNWWTDVRPGSRWNVNSDRTLPDEIS